MRARVGWAIAIVWLVLVLGGTAVQLIAYVTAPTEEIELCGYLWQRDRAIHRYTTAEIIARDGAPPVVVDPARDPTCPSKVCPTTGRCAWVVWLRVGDDAFVAYSCECGG